MTAITQNSWLRSEIERRCGFVALASWSPLEGGKSNRCFKVSDGEKTFVVKQYNAARQNPLFPNKIDDEWSAMGLASAQGLAPDRVWHDMIGAQHVLCYRYLPEISAPLSLSHAATVLGCVHEMPARTGFRRAPDHSDLIEMVVGQFLSELATETSDHILTHRPQHRVDASGCQNFLHGDPIPSNMVHGMDGMRLIDWQCPAIGDPAYDLALFLAPSMSAGYGREPLNADERRAFLNAYPNRQVIIRLHDLEPWITWMLAAYAAWRMHQGLDDSSLRLDLEMARLKSCSL